ncbi:MAG: hypothetical protein H6707_17215 [Deltaproteobacteria bacterium]|nr:hypothetical protein [Deltaproteobacteria bacterium]
MTAFRILASASLLLASCVGVDLGDAPFFCSSAGQCPEGYSCRAIGGQQVCARSGGFCGDGVCDPSSESCENCSTDCGCADQGIGKSDRGSSPDSGITLVDAKVSIDAPAPADSRPPVDTYLPDTTVDQRVTGTLTCDAAVNCVINCTAPGCEKQCAASVRPSSVALFNAFVNCIATAETGACSWTCPNGSSCGQCLAFECEFELMRCQADK